MAPVCQKRLAVSAYKVRHPSTAPDVPVQPEAASHGVDHTLATTREFPIGRLCHEAGSSALLTVDQAFLLSGRERRYGAPEDGAGKRVSLRMSGFGCPPVISGGDYLDGHPRRR
jgi:hypothetical protein